MSYETKTVEDIQLEYDAFKAWQRESDVNAKLDQGIENSLTWSEYKESSGCPDALRQRYLQRQKESGIAPHSVRNRKEPDPFVEGFRSGRF